MLKLEAKWLQSKVLDSEAQKRSGYNSAQGWLQQGQFELGRIALNAYSLANGGVLRLIAKTSLQNLR